MLMLTLYRKGYPVTGKDLHRLLGNVHIIHNEYYNVVRQCSLLSLITTRLPAYSRVHIEQGDTLDLYSDYLFYDGKTELALANGNVELIDKETHLYTNTINYDVRNRIATYTDRGKDYKCR